MFRDLLRELESSKISTRRKIFLILRFLSLKLRRVGRYWGKTHNLLSDSQGEEGKILRRVFYRRFFKHLGKRVSIDINNTFYHVDKISLEDDVRLGQNCYLNGYSEIEVGKRVLVGPYTMIHSANHKIPDKAKRIFDSGYEGKKIIIKQDALISGHCCVLSGVVVGEGAVLGAGAVATSGIREFSVWAGVPAKMIKER